MRTADSDHTFWSKPADAGAGWLDDLSSEPPDSAEARALDELAAGRHETDRVFHELRGVAAPTAAAPPVERAGGDDEAEDPLPPAASAAFDFDAVSDDLLPSWNLDLG